ncbi:MAG: thiolase family protein [Bdellovibrionota bacterium]
MSLVITSYKRTPFGSFGGGLSSLSATDLGVIASEAALKESNLVPDSVDSVCFGNVCQSSSDAIYLARHIGLRVGLPVDRPALTVNRLCGSGFESIAQAGMQILLGNEKCCLVGGTESMSQIPFVLRKARFGYRLGNSEVEDYLQCSLTDSYTKLPMAMTAERVGEKYKISRLEVDDYALESQTRYASAKSEGIFKSEITPVSLPSKKETLQLSDDEHPRPKSTLESLSSLPSLFKKEGLVTAGNASGICDGAAALVVADEDWAKSQGLPILAKIHSWAAVGCLPEEMGMGPVGAILKAISKLPESLKIKSVKDFKLVEVNEAFSAQYLAVEKELGLERSRTNIHGGAIAMGHPLAASGTRLTGHLALSLKKMGGGVGVASACIGGGQGMAVVIEV